MIKSIIKNNERYFILLVCSLISVGIILRIIYINKQSLWLDEMTTIQIASHSIRDILSGKLFDNHTPPLYYILIHYWGRISPLTEIGVRIPSVIFDIFNMILVIMLCKSLINNKNTIVVLSAYAISPFMIYYSQEGRMYTLLVLFSLLFSYSMNKLLNQEKKINMWTIITGITLSLGLYTHYYMVFFATGVYLLSIYTYRDSLNKIIAILCSWLIALVLFIPWIPIAINLAIYRGQQFRRFSFAIIPYTIFRFVIGYAVFPINMFTKDNFSSEIINHILELMAVFVACILITYALRSSLNESNKRTIWALCWITFIPFFISLIISMKSPMISERYLIIILPFMYIMFFGYIDLKKRFNVIATIIIFILFIMGNFSYYCNPDFGKAQWREAGAFITKYAAKNDIIIVEPGYAIPVFKYYYHGDKEAYSGSEVLGEKDLILNINKEYLKNNSRVILVTSGSKTDTRYSKYLEKLSKKIYSYTFPLETGITCSFWEFY